MATLKYCEDGTLISSKFSNKLKSAGETGIMEIVFDCSKKYSATAGSYAAIAATDVIELFQVPIGMKVYDATLTVLTPATAAATASVGDASSAAGFIAAGTAMNAAAGTQVGTVVGDAYGLAAAGGKLYTAADTVDITFAAQVPTPCVFRLELLVRQSNASTSINTMY